MASDRRFLAGLALRLGGLVAAMAGLLWSLAEPGLAAARIVAALLLAGMIWATWRHLVATNEEVRRFIDAIRHGDLSQRFSGTGGGVSPLGAEMDAAIIGLRAERKQLFGEGSFQAGLIDEVPTPLLTIDQAGRVTLANKAARRMFHTVEGTRAEDFAELGGDLAAHLAATQPAPYRLVSVLVDGVPQRAVLSTATLMRAEGLVRLVSVQPIQSALNTVEVAAQADLVRVLTHEIMNSMTPVTSLAESAAELMREVDIGADPAIADARIAVETLSRRARGIMDFVESYRQYSRAIQVREEMVDAAEWTAGIALLFEAMPAGEASVLDRSITPPDLRIEMDPDLMCQVILNLLKNGAESAQGAGIAPRLELDAAAIPGGRVQIAIADNGPGVPETLRDDVFLPFFTTKSSGTGVGLSLARKIVTAHGGSIRQEESASGGARFVIVL